MTLQEAIELLEYYNKWRRGEDIEQPPPISIGIAIDIVLHELKTKYQMEESLRRKELEVHI